ncbi:MAG: ankyrin repeat domain-containing protein [Wolbachia sp.]
MVGYYKVLKIWESASQAEIKTAYRKLSTTYHPDKNHGAAPEAVEELKENFQKISKAYRILSDPDKRALYDSRTHEKFIELEKEFGAERVFPKIEKMINNELLKAFKKKNLKEARELVRYVKNLNMVFSFNVRGTNTPELSLLLRFFVTNACKDPGWFEFYKDVLSEGGKIDLNTDVCTSGTALSYACREGNGNVAELLLNHGADVNKESVLSGKTPILIALENNDCKLANLLFQRGAKIDTTPELEQTIVANICSRDSKYKKEMKEILLQYTSPSQNTLMLKYFSSNKTSTDEDIEIVKLLLEKGADPFFGEPNVMQIATNKGNSKLIELFGEHEQNNKILKEQDNEYCVVNTFCEVMNTLNEAINNECYDKLNKIVDCRQEYDLPLTDLNSNNFQSFCSNYLNLNLQERSDHKYIYDNILSKYMLDTQGGNCNYSVKELMLLAIAASEKLTEEYKDVLLDQEDLKLVSLLLLVGGQKYINILSVKLKDNGIRAVSHEFFPTIALRKECNQFFAGHITEYLKTLENNNIIDTICSILDAALSVQNKDCIKTLLISSRKAQVNNADLLYLAACYSRETTRAFLNDGIDINVKGRNGMTPLHYAVLNDNSKALKLLLEQECFDVNARDSQSYTPLALAIERGKLEVIKLLLNHKASDFSCLYSAVKELKVSRGVKNISYLLIEKLEEEFRKTIAQFKQEDGNLANQVQIGELKEKLEKAEAELARNNETLERIQAELKIKKGEFANKEKELESKNKEVAGLTEEKNSLTSQVGDLKKANAELKEKASQVEENSQSKEKLNSEVNELREESNKTKAQLENLQKELDIKTKEFESKEVNIENSKKELDNKNQDLNAKTKENAQLKSTQAQLERERDSVKRELVEKTNQVTRLKEKLEKAEAQFTEEEKALNVANEKILQSQKELEDMEVLLRQEQESANEKLTQEQQKTSHLNGQVDQLTEELKGTKTQFEENKRELDAVKENVSQLKEYLKQAKQDASTSNDQTAQLTEQNIQLRKQLDSAQQNLTNKTGEVTQLTKENTQLQSVLKSTQKTFYEKTNELKDKQAHLEEKEERLNVANEKVSQLEHETLSKQASIDGLTNEKSQLLSENSRLAKEKDLGNENKKLSTVSAQSRKQVTYASVSFVLSGALAVGASLTMFRLAICISLAVAASTFLVVGCYCAYKANTALSNVEIENGYTCGSSR